MVVSYARYPDINEDAKTLAIDNFLEFLNESFFAVFIPVNIPQAIQITT